MGRFDEFAVLDFWFQGLSDDSFNVDELNTLWYGGGDAVDRQIELLFGRVVEEVLELNTESITHSADGVLALILVLDQFTRNVFRGTARAFSGDKKARRLLKKALEQNVHKKLGWVRQSFFYMPLEHSEDLGDQDLGVMLFEQLLHSVPVEGKEYIQSALDYALQHRAIIRQFGRFPHRNNVLGRESTPEELKYLEEGASRFGQ